LSLTFQDSKLFRYRNILAVVFVACCCMSQDISPGGFYVHISMHHKSMYLEVQRNADLNSLYIFYCQVTLHVSGVSRTHHQEYTNCSYNHWYRSWIWRYNDKILL